MKVFYVVAALCLFTLGCGERGTTATDPDDANPATTPAAPADPATTDGVIEP